MVDNNIIEERRIEMEAMPDGPVKEDEMDKLKTLEARSIAIISA